MSKAILVLNEMPTSCKECQFASVFIDPDFTCLANNKRITIGIDKKPDWCPLVELPEKLDEWYGDDTDAYERGYNACLDEIEK